MRTRLLTNLILYCSRNLAEIATHPYNYHCVHGAAVDRYREAIDRASRHLQGYVERHSGTGCATWVKVIDMRDGESCASLARRAVMS